MLLQRYVLKEHIGPFFLGLITLTFILIMNQIFVLVWDIVGKGLRVLTVLQMLFLYLPSIMALSIPMAVMIASFMAFGRLAQDSEVTAMRALGVNPLHLNFLPLILGSCLMVFMVWFNNHTLPESNHKLKNLMIDIAQKKPHFRMKALVLQKDFEGYNIQVGNVDYKRSEIYNVKLFEKETSREIFARMGLFYTDSSLVTMILKDGEIHELLTPDRYRRLSFKEHRIYLPLDQKFIRHNREYRGDRELSARALKERIKEVQENPNKNYRKRKIYSLLVEYHKKYSIPFACVVFILAGCPLAVKIKRGGAGASFGLALIFFIFYYICLIGGEGLGDRGVVAPWLSMWFPNIALLLLAGWASLRANK